MVHFNNLNQEIPYQILKTKYDEALNAGQKSIEAITISSYNNRTHEVDSRYVNLKLIENDEFIFFSNYNSPKAASFNAHSQISALLFWPTINVQIRMKAKIKKTSIKFNQQYFLGRSEEKNALAISSYQSKPIGSFNQVKENFNKSLKEDDLRKCPEYWGGYSFTPYYFEFWKGHKNRLNKREIFTLNEAQWDSFIAQP